MFCIWNVKPEERHCKMCKIVRCPDSNRTHSSHTGFLNDLRSLKINQQLQIPIEKYSTARSLAHRLNKDFGVKIRVLKNGNLITAIRVK